MKPVLSVILIFLLVIVAVHHSLASGNYIKRRYYDKWSSYNVDNSDEDVNLFQIYPPRPRNNKKDDLCSNKPLWYLKYQARLGKLSPFYECLNAPRI